MKWLGPKRTRAIRPNTPLATRLLSPTVSPTPQSRWLLMRARTPLAAKAATPTRAQSTPRLSRPASVTAPPWLLKSNPPVIRPQVRGKERGRVSFNHQWAAKAVVGTVRLNSRVASTTLSRLRAKKKATGPRKKPENPWPASSQRSETCKRGRLLCRPLRSISTIASPQIRLEKKNTLQKLITSGPPAAWVRLPACWRAFSTEPLLPPSRM